MDDTRLFGRHVLRGKDMIRKLEHSLQDGDGVGVTLAYSTGDRTPQAYQVMLCIWGHLPYPLLLKLFFTAYSYRLSLSERK